jgi:hypothetical protein
MFPGFFHGFFLLKLNSPDKNKVINMPAPIPPINSLQDWISRPAIVFDAIM